MAALQKPRDLFAEGAEFLKKMFFVNLSRVIPLYF